MALLKVVATRVRISASARGVVKCDYTECTQRRGKFVLVEIIGDAPKEHIGKQLFYHERCLRQIGQKMHISLN